MNPIPKLLSKTKLMRGYRCLKCIYLTIHHPEFETPITPETEALFNQGNIIGAEARKHYPGGVLIDNKHWDFSGALAKTRELIANGTTIIYEAAFEYMGCYARTDIIQYSPETKRWKIFEVKSATKVKPEHYDDIGLQAWILAKSGLPIEQINIVHINSECTYPNLSNLFKEVDVTNEIREKYLSVQPKVHSILTTIRQPEIPNVDIGPHCLQSTECVFKNHCWQEKNIPELSIFNLPNIKDNQWKLYNENIISLDDARLTNLSELQERVINCFKSGERYLDKEKIHASLSEWQFPLIFLDFETINPAIPRYNGCHPYEHVPFQFSVHIWPTPDADIIHKEFLQENSDDPRPALIPALLNACGEQGSIVAYYGKFEAARIQSLADYSSNDKSALLKLVDRIVDPLPIIREAIYDNKFMGSFSLKSVAPVLLGDTHSYEGMLVSNGSEAQRGFEELIAPSTNPTRKNLLKNALIEYCKKDTLEVVELVKWLLKF